MKISALEKKLILRLRQLLQESSQGVTVLMDIAPPDLQLRTVGRIERVGTIQNWEAVQTSLPHAD